MPKVKEVECKNIYITNDEKIKEGDWCYDEFLLSVFQANCIMGVKTKKTSSKIILTTDPDLIKDGVQEIDDEFLEWFVKNPSCEFVDVEKDYIDLSDLGYYVQYTNYKIIIPKEEVKSLVEKMKPLQEQWQQDMDKSLQEPKQETLEEALEREFPIIKELKHSTEYKASIAEKKLAFMFGAKWQAERMYSEEDMKQFGLYLGDNFKKLKGKTIDEIFEQFKKK
jgi:hypothetical protein